MPVKEQRLQKAPACFGKPGAGVLRGNSAGGWPGMERMQALDPVVSRLKSGLCVLWLCNLGQAV